MNAMRRWNPRWAVSLASALSVLAWAGMVGCRERGDQEVWLRVHVHDWATPEVAVPNVQVTLEEQRLVNGVLNAFFTEVDAATTDANGTVELATVRSNILALRVVVASEGCFNEVIELNPEEVASNGVWNEVNAFLMPKCVVQATVAHTGSCTTQPLLYRWIPREVEGSASELRWTCNTTWNAVPAQAVDETTCLLTGDTYLLHQRVWNCGGSDSTVVDSVWCPKGGLVALDL